MNYDFLIEQPEMLIGVRYNAYKTNNYLKIHNVTKKLNGYIVIYCGVNRKTHEASNIFYGRTLEEFIDLLNTDDKFQIFKEDKNKLFRKDKIKSLLDKK